MSNAKHPPPCLVHCQSGVRSLPLGGNISVVSQIELRTPNERAIRPARAWDRIGTFEESVAQVPQQLANMQTNILYQRHHDERTTIYARPEDIFAFVDDHARFSSHMSQSSWMMGGGRMDISVDAELGQKIGSHIHMDGRAFGLNLHLDEVVTRYEPPRLKTWETVGEPDLLIIGGYRMGIKIESENERSLLSVFIDYNLPARNAWLGRLFGEGYAKWCVRQMILGVRENFTRI